MDHDALTRSLIKAEIKAQYFEAVSEGITGSEFRKIIEEALAELEEPVPDNLKQAGAG